MHILSRAFRLLLTAIALLALTGAVLAQAAPQVGSNSGLPLPRFVSLATSPVNVRQGPTTEHRIAWRYTKAQLPVEIIQESDNWRKIRDWTGAEGWVLHNLLGSSRTVLVMPWDLTAAALPLHKSASVDSAVVAWLMPGALASVSSCDGRFCRISGSGFSGWAEQSALYGVYPNEVI